MSFSTWGEIIGFVGLAFLSLSVCHRLVSYVRLCRSVRQWLSNRGEILLRFKNTNAFDLFVLEVRGRKKSGELTQRLVGVRRSFLTGQVHEVFDLEKWGQHP